MLRVSSRFALTLLTIAILLLTVTPARAQGNFPLTADQTNLTRGQCTTLHWSVPSGWSSWGTQNFHIQSAPSSMGIPFQGSQQVCPSDTTVYTISITFLNGTRRDGSVRITVAAPQPPPAPTSPPVPQQANQVSFTADQTTVNSGQCTTLRWHTVNGVFVNYNNAQSWETVPGFDNPQVANGSEQVCPTSTTTYNLYVRFADGSRQSQSVTVNVSVPPPLPQQQQSQPQQPQPIQPPAAANVPLSVNFYADPSTITAGQCTTLYWHVVGNNPAEKPGASIGPPTEDYGSVAPVPDGAGKVCPSSTTTYTLYGDDVNRNPWERKVTVTVVQQPAAAPAVQPMPVQLEHGSLSELTDLNDSYHFTQAEYETIKNLLLTAPDSKACVEIIGTIIAGEVDFDTALHAVDTVNSCSTGLNEINGILEKYLHHDEPNMLPMNLDGYCTTFYNGNIVVPDRNKPYDWKCVTQTSTVVLDGTKMADVCQAQHPMQPDAVLLDNNDAYSWVCIRKSWIVGQN